MSYNMNVFKICDCCGVRTDMFRLVSTNYLCLNCYNKFINGVK